MSHPRHDIQDATTWLSAHPDRHFLPIALTAPSNSTFPELNVLSQKIVSRLLNTGVLNVFVPRSPTISTISTTTIYLSLPHLVPASLVAIIFLLRPDVIRFIRSNLLLLRWD